MLSPACASSSILRNISIPVTTVFLVSSLIPEMTIELIHPIAMEQGLTFAIREGGRTVGSGRVATIIE